MKMRKELIFAATALMLAACSNDESMDNSPVELRLTSGLQVQTRATHGLDTQLKGEEQVHVWVDDATTGDALYKNNVLAKNDDATANLYGGTSMYFPQTGNNIDIYALHGNMTLPTDNTYPTSTLTHTVEADQRSSVSEVGKGYQGSDLVYAKVKNQGRTSHPTTTVNLAFNHLLSKIEIVLIEGAGEADFLKNIEKLEVLGTKATASFTLSKESPAYGKNTEKTDGIEITATGENTQAISLDTSISPGSAATVEANQSLNEAIIVPQTLAANTPFIKITLKAGATFTYNLEKETAFESGKKYKYIITVNHTELKVASSIADWTGTTATTGNATMN